MQDLKAQNPNLSFEDTLMARVNALGGSDGMDWIYQNDIKEVWEDFIRSETGV